MAKRHATPKHLPAPQQKEWNGRYDTALEVAKRNNPDDEATQHSTALKEANKMLAVSAPQSAAEIDKLANWQVTKREDRVIGGVPHRVCVTIDGKKYTHPKKEQNTPPEKK